MVREKATSLDNFQIRASNNPLSNEDKLCNIRSISFFPQNNQSSMPYSIILGTHISCGKLPSYSSRFSGLLFAKKNVQIFLRVTFIP